MAPIPATMTVNFISNYAGPHRVCWRIGNSGPYDCTTIVNCLGGGNACQAIIPITVDNETCDQVDFNGYVQATCEVEGSLNGRVPFSVVFIPNPPCDKFDVICSSVSIDGYTVLNPGSGYVVGSNPAVTVVGGGGTLAAAIGIVGDGGIETWALSSGGTGYLGGGTGAISTVPALNITGTGTGAEFDIIITGGVITSIALSNTNTSPGTGYNIADTFEFDNSFLGGTGAGVVVTIETVNTGKIQYIQVTSTGSGYTSVPTATVAASVGVTATVEARLGTCNQFNAGTDCSGAAIGFLPRQDLGYIYKICAATAPVPPAQWTVTQDGCCYDCVTVNFANTNIPGPDRAVQVINCDGEFAELTLPTGSSVIACVVNDSWYWPVSDNTTASVGAAC